MHDAGDEDALVGDDAFPLQPAGDLAHALALRDDDDGRIVQRAGLVELRAHEIEQDRKPDDARERPA